MSRYPLSKLGDERIKCQGLRVAIDRRNQIWRGDDIDLHTEHVQGVYWKLASIAITDRILLALAKRRGAQGLDIRYLIIW